MSTLSTPLTPAEQQFHLAIGETYETGIQLGLSGVELFRVNMLYMLAVIAHKANYPVLDEQALQEIIHEYNTNPTLESNLILQLINSIELIENITRSSYNERTVSDLQESRSPSGITNSLPATE
jgi:hypothetical protein